MENPSLVNVDHLLQCKEALPGVPPQLRLSLASTILRIREVNKVELREQTETCGYCLTDVDVAKDGVEFVKRNKAEIDRLKITCHIWKKVCRSNSIEVMPERRREVTVATKRITGLSKDANVHHTRKRKNVKTMKMLV